VINEYLDDAFPDVPLRPEDPVERARMRIWSKFVDDVLMPAVSRLGWQLRFREFAAAIPEDEFERRMQRVPLMEMRVKWSTIHGAGFTHDQLEESRRRIRHAIDLIEAALEARPWLVGAGYSLADVNTYPNAEGASRLDPDYCNEKRAPRTAHWLRRIAERRAVTEAYAMSRFGNAPGRAVDAARR
jgi:glutathione S-transferase